MRILIVEDECRLAEMIKERLEKDNYTVDVAYDGERGLYKAQSGIYDLLILDVMLPGLSGLDLLRNIREQAYAGPVLMLTAKAETDDKVNGLDMGADDYMTKPFEMKELLARVRALTRRNRKPEEDEYRYEDLRLCQGRLMLRSISSGQEVMLGSKEYLLMEYLMQNPNQILSKDQISNKVWGYENCVEYNNAEVYISFLRKKISFLKSKVKIKTVRGVGYCLEADGGAE